MKFDFNRPSGSRGEDVGKCEHTTHRQTDRQQPCHMISSPELKMDQISFFFLYIYISCFSIALLTPVNS